MPTTQHFLYSLHLADNSLILAQRNGEWTGHGPVLEQDIAITNIALDLMGQARNFYSHAAALYNGFGEAEKAAVDDFVPRFWKTYNRGLEEDDLAFLRDEPQYLNLLLAELPKGDWAFSILRQFLFSAFQFCQYSQLQQSDDPQLGAIAEKGLKEVKYHLRWSGEWVIRLGDGTEESNRRLNNALRGLWPFTGELFKAAKYEAMDVARLKEEWLQKVTSVFEEATLPPVVNVTGDKPEVKNVQSGKEGRHTEHLAPLLNEMQSLQRTYPNLTW